MMAKRCSVPDCGKPSHCHDWCVTHYNRWRYCGDPLGVRATQRPYKPPKRVHFTPGLWDKWLTARQCDAHTYVLLEGIQELRALLNHT
jgi:hypothetical protein